MDRKVWMHLRIIQLRVFIEALCKSAQNTDDSFKETGSE